MSKSTPEFIIQQIILRWDLSICCCYSVTKLCPTLGNSTGCSTPGFPVLHYLSITYLQKVHFKLLPGIVPIVDTLGSKIDTELFPSIYSPF